MTVHLVEVVSEKWILTLDFVVSLPVLQSFHDVFIADLEHLFGIFSTSLLQAPCGGVVKVEATLTSALIILLEVVAHLETWVCRSLLEQAIGTLVVVFDFLCCHPVLKSILFDLGFWLRAVATDSYIKNDIGVVIDDLHALLDCTVKVNIPDGATIHEHITIQMLRWEDDWDRAR